MSAAATDTAVGREAPAGPASRARARLGRLLFGRRRPPLGLLLAAITVGLLAALPAAYLAITIAGDLSNAADAVLTTRTLEVTLRTVALVAAVTISATVLAVPLAWLTVRTDLPARRLWATLTTLPLVVPSYIGAYLLVSAFGPRGILQDALEPLGIERLPSVYGFVGAWLALTLFTYPLVLIPARGALRRLDADLEEAARSMGRGPIGIFRTVVLPQLIPAIGAGGLLVALYTLSDFGAVSIMRFNSLTREIYVVYQSSFDRTEAAALGGVLVVAMLILLALYARLRGARAYHRAGPGAGRPARPVSIGRWRVPALAFCAAVVAVALVLPVGLLVYWSTLQLGDGVAISSALTNAGNSLLVASIAALLGVLGAACIAAPAIRFPGRVTSLVERIGYAGYALPGIVVALALVFFGTRVALPLYQTLAMLAFALTIHYLPLAVGPLSAAMLHVPPRLEEAARGLGRGPLEAFRTITAPLMASGALAGAALVFLHAVKELPATLVLAPIGFETLATDIWRQTSSGFFEAAAIPALILLLIAAPPLYLLSEKGTVTS